MTEQGTFDTLEPIEKAGIDELRSLQLQRLKWTLEHTYANVESYRKKFDAAGVHPSDLKQLGDLSKFPFTDKRDMRDNYPFGMFAVPMDDVVRIHASSGTTGKPVVVGYTRNDIDTWSRVVVRSIRAAGGNHKDKIHVAYGYGLFTGGLGAHYGGELMGCTVIPMSGGQTEKQALLIQDFDPDIIMVTPSYMLSIADELERQGVDCRKLRLRVGIFGAEPWTDSMRANLEQRLDIDAVDIYGLSEVMGPGVAQECVETKDGPTIWEDHFYPEIIDPQTGEVLPDGEEGELVFTSLTKEALPVVRYRTRDLTRLLPGTARTMRRMNKITGRSGRHADHPRRERIPHPGGRAGPQGPRPGAPLPDRDHPPRQLGRDDRQRGISSGRRRNGETAGGCRAEEACQGSDRRFGKGQRSRRGRRGALGRKAKRVIDKRNL